MRPSLPQSNHVPQCTHCSNNKAQGRRGAHAQYVDHCDSKTHRHGKGQKSSCQADLRNKAAHRQPKIRFDPTCFLIKSVYLPTHSLQNSRLLHSCSKLNSTETSTRFSISIGKKMSAAMYTTLLAQSLSSKRPLPQTLPRRRQREDTATVAGATAPRSPKLISHTHIHTHSGSLQFKTETSTRGDIFVLLV